MILIQIDIAQFLADFICFIIHIASLNNDSIVELHKRQNPASIRIDMFRKLFRNYYCTNIFTTRPFRTNFNKKLKPRKQREKIKLIFILVFCICCCCCRCRLVLCCCFYFHSASYRKKSIKKIMLYTFFSS